MNHPLLRMTMHDHAWTVPPAHVALEADAVHVWRASLDPPLSARASLLAALSADERKKAARFVFERDRQRFVVGRGVLRTLLAQYTSIAPEQIRFSYNAAGKPALVPGFGSAQWHFNVTHSHGLTLYAIARRPLGVDLERIRPLANAAQLARRICSRRERAMLARLSPGEQPAALLRCWTGKEAYVKACGQGLARPLDQIEVAPALWAGAGRLCIATDAAETARWWLQEVNPAPGYVAALVVEGAAAPITCWQWRQWF